MQDSGHDQHGDIFFESSGFGLSPVRVALVSSVTLRQPDSSGGTLTYEGRFEILSLTGSFMPSETGGIRNRSGGMSVSLASPDGRVAGGGVAGLLMAASPVQIIVGSFLAINQHEQRPKRLKPEPFMTVAPTGAVPITSVGIQDQFGDQGQQRSKIQDHLFPHEFPWRMPCSLVNDNLSSS